MDDVHARLEQLEEAVGDHLAGHRSPDQRGASANYWLTLEAAVSSDLDGLDDWVEWLVAAYELGPEWPACWQSHPGLHLEVAALFEWHRGVYAAAEREVSAALYWHEALSRFRSRSLPTVRRGCARGCLLGAQTSASAT